MDCTKCLYEVACDLNRRMSGNNNPLKYDKECPIFKDKSLYIELPCKVGDKVAIRALCECVITTPCYEECRNICPFEDECECEECDGCNERIFDTKVSAIYNNGNGWLIEFEHIIIQARFTDIGTSFFVGENAHEQAEAYEKALAEREANGGNN